MKKFLSIVFVVLFFSIASVFFGCNGKSVKIKYYSSGAEVLPLLRQGVLDYAVLPEPAATQISNISSDTFYRLDLQSEYDADIKSYPQAVVMVKNSLLNSYGEVVDFLRDNVDASVEWVKNNIDKGIGAINGKLGSGITPTFNSSNLTPDIITRSNVYFESAVNSKTSVKNYIDDIISVGDGISAPAVSVTDEFFYDGENDGQASFIKESIDLYCPDGAPSLAIAKMIYDNSDLDSGLPVNYHVVSSNDIGSKMATGAGDIVILPINAGTKLYDKTTDPYKLVGVVTHGNLYLISRHESTVLSLDGKTVGVIGQGLVPDLTFKCILRKNNLSFEVAI